MLTVSFAVLVTLSGGPLLALLLWTSGGRVCAVIKLVLNSLSLVLTSQGFQQKFSFHSKEIVAISCSWCKQAVSLGMK